MFGSDGSYTLVGGDGNDRLGGGTGSDTMDAGIGSDRLNGGAGVDIAAGGVANDTVIVDTAADVVLETAAGGAEDVIRSDALAYTLAIGADGFTERANINRGAGDASLIGNENDNTLIGNSGDNILRGLGGADEIEAGAGDDRVLGDGAGDLLKGESGTDTIAMGTADTVFGGSDGPVIRDFDGVSSGAANGADKLVFVTGLEIGSFTCIDGAAFSGSGNSEARFASTHQLQVDLPIRTAMP